MNPGVEFALGFLRDADSLVGDGLDDEPRRPIHRIVTSGCEGAIPNVRFEAWRESADIALFRCVVSNMIPEFVQGLETSKPVSPFRICGATALIQY